MGVHHNSDTSARGAWMLDTIEIKYLGWYITHPHLFGQPPSAYMAPGASVHITVQANGVNGDEVHLAGVYDPSLEKALIATRYAEATDGRIVRFKNGLLLNDGDGNTYTSCSYITLTWWERYGLVSESEDFYITEDLPNDRQAMIRRLPADCGKKALPLFTKIQTADEKKRADEKRKQENTTHSLIRQTENQKVEDKIRDAASPNSKKSSKRA